MLLPLYRMSPVLSFSRPEMVFRVVAVSYTHLDVYKRQGEKTLRAKIDLASPNMNMRDPAIYLSLIHI